MARALPPHEAFEVTGAAHGLGYDWRAVVGPVRREVQRVAQLKLRSKMALAGAPRREFRESDTGTKSRVANGQVAPLH